MRLLLPSSSIYQVNTTRGRSDLRTRRHGMDPPVNSTRIFIPECYTTVPHLHDLWFEGIPRLVQRTKNRVCNHPLLNRGIARAQLCNKEHTTVSSRVRSACPFPYLVRMQFCNRLGVFDLDLIGSDQLVHPNFLPVQLGPQNIF